MKKTTLFMAIALFLGVASTSAAELAKCEINKAMPEGWTYVSSDPEKYPNPEFYSDGGLKMRYINQGIESPAFSAASNVNVIINIKALNNNTKQEDPNIDPFTVTGYNEAGEEVSSATLKEVAVGENTVALEGSGIVKVKIIMTDYYSDGSVCKNVSLGGVTVNDEAGSGFESIEANAPSFFVSNGELVVSNVAEGTTVEIYNALGARVQTSVFDGAAINVSDLTKGIYVVRAGKNTQKVMF